MNDIVQNEVIVETAIETAQVAIHIALGTAALAMAVICLAVLVVCIKNMITDILEQRAEGQPSEKWVHMPGVQAGA